MRALSLRGDELERLVDRHIELSELFDGSRPSGRVGPPFRLVTLAGGKATADCLADLVDRALVAYEGTGFTQDATILALKAALVQAIMSQTP